MSYSLAIDGGDLALRGSSMGIVHGIDKLKQDLQLHILERFGGDRFHPDMGSILQDMIGGVIDGTTARRITTELARVLDNYQRLQYRALKDNPTLLSVSELLYAIDDISVSIGYDSAIATIKIRSAAGDATSITVNQGL